MNERNRMYLRIIGGMVSAILLSVAQAASDNSAKTAVISNQPEASGIGIKLSSKVSGRVVQFPEVGGLHHHYERLAVR